MATKKSYWHRALVTGASAGIGEQFARLLAKRGVNLVLVARDERKLRRIEQEISKKHGVEVEVLAADLTEESGLASVEARLKLEVSPIELLVNCAAFGTVGRFHQLPLAAEIQEIHLNVLSLVRLTHAATGRMVKGGHGSIMNISSISGFIPGPGTTTYCATKAFVTMFTESLSGELKGTGVSVTAIHPGYTRTEFQARSGMDATQGSVPGFMWMSAESVAEYSLRAAQRGKVIGVPGLGYRIIVGIVGALPRGLRRTIGERGGATSHLAPIAKS